MVQNLSTLYLYNRELLYHFVQNLSTLYLYIRELLYHFVQKKIL